MNTFFKNVLSTIAGMIISFFLIILLSAGFITIVLSTIEGDETISIEPETILKIDFSNKIVERSSGNPIENFSTLNSDAENPIELKQVLDNIEKAKNDDNIKAIYINTGSINSGLSQLEEVRNKLLAFKNTGKPIIAYAEYYSQIAYYFATVADKIYLNPEGIIELKGLSAEIMFFKGLFDKLDVDIQVIRHGKFKSAIEPYILEKMSEENRAQLKILLNSISDNIMDSIASQRNLNSELVDIHANQLTLNSAAICKELGYVDGLLYQDQVEDSLRLITETDDINFINLQKYTRRKLKKQKKISRDKIAIIYATGEISSGKGSASNIGSETTAKAIKEARKDKRVKAIVLRINSPGGSALASDVIWRETTLAKKEKPLVVSMGDLAASGGYYIACAADSIIANPTTITGSIGVFGIIPNMKNFYNSKLGITLDTVNTHRYADMGINRSLTKYEKIKIKQSVSDIYDQFISNVAEGRNMTKEEVNKIGEGRVWSGYNAREIGLIDNYGGIEKAISIAANLAEIENYRVISLPEKEDPLTTIIKDLSGESKLKNLLAIYGINSTYSDHIKNILNMNDPIQARIPFSIELE